jgi:Bacterial type II/III secretion system short domain
MNRIRLLPPVALLLAGMLGAAALVAGRAAGQPPAPPAPREGKPPATPAPAGAEVKIFTLRNTDAVEVAKTLQQLFPAAEGRMPRIAVHQSTNSVLVRGMAEDLEVIAAVLAHLEEVPAKKAAGPDATRGTAEYGAPATRPATGIPTGGVKSPLRPTPNK